MLGIKGRLEITKRKGVWKDSPSTRLPGCAPSRLSELMKSTYLEALEHSKVPVIE